MAHECPECGQVCYCCGDIDDCLLNDPVAESNCVHWQICDIENKDIEDYDDNYDNYDPIHDKK